MIVRIMGSRLIALLVSLACCLAQAAEITKDWQLVYPDPGQDEMYCSLWSASETLRDCIEESLGFRLPVLANAKAAKGARTIWVGGFFAERAGVMPKDFARHDNGIAVKDGDIYLFGRDRAGCHPRSHWRHDLIPSFRAATRFMEKFAGARFVMPGNVGREYARRDRIALPDDYADREAPYFECDCQNVSDTTYHHANGLIGGGGYFLFGGHAYPAACPWEKYHETHPEYFALRGGQRAKGPTRMQQALCISNPEVEELIVREVERRLDAGADVCELGQNDGDARCECANCRALFGTGDDWGEKLWLYHRRIAERILKERPGKRVLILCYAATARPPKTFRRFPANVMIELCGYSEDDFRKWSAYEVPCGYVAYLYHWGNYHQLGYTPKRSFAGCARLLERLRRNNVRGIYRCGYGELYGIEGAQYYVFNRLAVDPKADASAALDEFCAGAFGAAAEPMRRFYVALDERLRAFDLLSETYSESSGHLAGFGAALPKDPLDLIAYTYSPSAVQVMEGCLKTALKTPGLTEKQRKRLALVRMEFDYARNLGRIATLYAAYRAEPTEATFQPLGDAILERNAMLDRIFDEKGDPRPIPGWKGITVFGGAKRAMVQTNGRLSGKIGAPLDWDVARFRRDGVLPGPTRDIEKWKKYNADHGLKPITDWRRTTWKWLPEDVRFQPRRDGAAFVFSPGTNTDVRIETTFTPARGLKPNTRYRLSWFARLEDVRAFGAGGGFYATAYYDRHPGFVSEPSDRPLTGTTGWVHQMLEFTTCPRADFSSNIAFRIYNAQGEVEIEDVVIEEVK